MYIKTGILSEALAAFMSSRSQRTGGLLVKAVIGTVKGMSEIKEKKK